MQKKVFNIALFLAILTTFSSCVAIEGIFKAGMGFGIFMVIAVISLIAFFIIKMTRNK
jgi:uncharacterized membrane protein